MDFGRELYFMMLLICISECVGKLVTRPQNTAVLEGDEVLMNCSTDNHDTRLIWKHLNSASPGNLVILYTGNKFASPYNSTYGMITEKRGEFGLKFRANSSMSLYYLCEEPGVEAFGADLIVLQSPKCEHIKSSGSDSDSHRYRNITVKCTIRFKGCLSPELNWTMETTDENHQLQNSLYTTNDHSDDFLISTATVAAQQNLNNSRLNCKLNFTTRRSRSLAHCTASNNRSYNTSENVPEYSFDWKSPTFTVSLHSNEWYFEIKEDASEGDGEAVSLPTFIVISIVIGFILFGNALMCRALIKARKTYIFPYYVTVPGKERSSLTHHSGIDNAAGTERVEDIGTEAGEANSTEDPGLNYESSEHGREQDAQKATKSKSTAKSNYVELREVRKSRNLKTDKNVISKMESKCSEYVRMDQATARPSCSPSLNPPQISQTSDFNVAGCSSSYTGIKPPGPMASQVESVEYVQMEFPSVKAKPVKRTYENTIFSCVEVYASIDHNAKTPPPPPPPPSAPSLPPLNLPVDTIDESDDETTTI